MKAHLPQTINRTLLQPRHHIMCSWFLEGKDIPCSLADILRHSCLYFCLWSFCCWPHGVLEPPLSLSALSSFSLSRSLSSALDSLQSPPGSNGSFCISHKCLFMALRLERLKLYPHSVMTVLWWEGEYGSCISHVGVVFSGCGHILASQIWCIFCQHVTKPIIILSKGGNNVNRLAALSISFWMCDRCCLRRLPSGSVS